MRAWPRFPLPALCEINPPAPEPPSRSASVSFVPMSAVNETYGHLDPSQIVSAKAVAKGYTGFRDEDVLFAKITPCMENGKAAIARGLAGGIGFGSTEFHVLRAGPLLLPDFLLLYVRQEDFRRRAKMNFVGSGGHMRVPESFFSQCSIPLPPLREQSHIVEILREAEAVRRHQSQAARTASELIPALFQQMFGDPLSWSHGPKLADLVEIVGGGTPSRAVSRYFDGPIPWATSSDVKKLYLDDSEEHITEEAIANSATKKVPAGSILIVVKSKILMHTLPLCITTQPFCFGQDLKGLVPKQGIPAEYVLWGLKAQTELILKRARGANTEGLTIDAIKGVRLPTDARSEMQKFQSLARHTHDLANKPISPTNELYSALLAHAFDGRLTAKWRERNARRLAIEAAQRDAALAAKGIKTAKAGASAHPADDEQASIYATPTDGAWSDLTARQRALWRFVRVKGAFGVADLLYARDQEPLLAPLSEDGFRRELEVFVARGALVQVSRPQITSEDEREVFRHYYRRVPLPENETGWNGPSVKSIAQQLRARLTS